MLYSIAGVVICISCTSRGSVYASTLNIRNQTIKKKKPEKVLPRAYFLSTPNFLSRHTIVFALWLSRFLPLWVVAFRRRRLPYPKTFFIEYVVDMVLLQKYTSEYLCQIVYSKI